MFERSCVETLHKDGDYGGIGENVSRQQNQQMVENSKILKSLEEISLKLAIVETSMNARRKNKRKIESNLD